MCYCPKIKEMMEMSKEKNEAIISSDNNSTMYVKYDDQYEEYTLQYSWIITEGTDDLRNNMQNVLSEHLKKEFEGKDKLDIIQVGVVSIYTTDADHFCKLIDLSKAKKLKVLRDTKYVFCGKKVLRVMQYYGQFSNPFECIDKLSSWCDSISSNDEPELKTNLMRGIKCNYSNDNKTIKFSIGCDNKKALFTLNVDKNLPQFLCIDSIQGNIEMIV